MKPRDIRKRLDRLVKSAGVFTGDQLDPRIGSAPKGIRAPTFKQVQVAALVDGLIEEDGGRDYSRESLGRFIRDVADPIWRSGREVSQDDANGLVARLAATPQSDITIARPIFGVRNSDAEPLVLGPVQLMRWSMVGLTAEPNPIAAALTGERQEVDPNAFFVVTTCKAREVARAVEMADARFRHVQHSLRMIVGNSDYHVAIFDNRPATAERYFVGIEGKSAGGWKRVGPLCGIELRKHELLSHDAGIARVWDLSPDGVNGDLEARLVRSIDWFGRAAYDSDSADAFVQYLFALESLLTVNHASVSKQVAEGAAFLLGATATARKDVYDHARTLYSLRSDIVHGKRSMIEPEELSFAARFTRRVILRLLASPPFSTMKTASAVQDWIQQQRFSVKGDA